MTLSLDRLNALSQLWALVDRGALVSGNADFNSRDRYDQIATWLQPRKTSSVTVKE